MRPKLLLLVLVVVVGVAGLAVAGLITFGTAPPSEPAIQSAANAELKEASLPRLQRFEARDGSQLAYRAWIPARRASPVVAILIHGAAGSSADMVFLGQALAAAGIPAYAPDIRGHGDSGRRGDIDRIGQLEDDLTDLTALVRVREPGSRLVLVGHSSGGGFALRVAGEPQGQPFSRFVLLAPYLGHAAPTSRPGGGGTAPYIGRIIGLSLLNWTGVTALNGLPTLAFATAPGHPPQLWSYRLMTNFAADDDYMGDLRRSAGKIAILVGAHDERMYADQYGPLLSTLAPPPPMTVLPGLGHMAVVSDPSALKATVDAVSLGGRP